MILNVNIPDRIYNEYLEWCKINQIDSDDFIYNAFYDKYMLSKYGDLNEKKKKNTKKVDKKDEQKIEVNKEEVIKGQKESIVEVQEEIMGVPPIDISKVEERGNRKPKMVSIEGKKVTVKKTLGRKF